MVNNDDVDETTLNAYLDGELDAQLQQAVLCAVCSDARVREQVRRLRMSSDWMKVGFAGRLGDAPRLRPKGIESRRRLRTALAALLATLGGLCVGPLGRMGMLAPIL